MSVPVADRYNGLAVGPRLAYIFATQEGVPVDGTSPHLRDLSPFVLRLLPPDALLSMASELLGNTSAEAPSVDLITAAALGADYSGSANAAADALSTVSAVGDLTSATEDALASFVAAGRFFTGRTDGFTSTLADAFTAADIGLQVLKILTVPPLSLLVNPSEMSIAFTKVQTYQTRTRFGYVFEAWGEDQPTISFSGSTAGFVAGAVSAVGGQTTSPSGYQESARLDSAAWQNFTSMYHFYRNNGYIYDTISRSEAHQFIGGIAIDYDQWTYVGSIESFSFAFEATSPHRVTWDMEFRVSRMYDRAMSSAAVVPQSSPTTQPTTHTRASRTSRPSVAFAGSTARLDPTQTDEATIPFDILGTS